MHDKKLLLPCIVALGNKIVPFKNIANVMNDEPARSKVKTRSGRTATVFNCDNKRTKVNVLLYKSNVRNSNEQNSKRTNNISNDTNLIENKVVTRRSNLSDEQKLNKVTKIDTKNKTRTNKTHESQSSEKHEQTKNNLSKDVNINDINLIANNVRTRRSNNRNLSDTENLEKVTKIVTKNKAQTNKTHESRNSEKHKRQAKNNLLKEVNTRVKTRNNINKQNSAISDVKTKKPQTRSNLLKEVNSRVKTRNNINKQNSIISDEKTKKSQTRSNNKGNESQKLDTTNLNNTNKAISKDSGLQNVSLEKSDAKITRAPVTKSRKQSKEVQNDLEPKRVRKIPNYRESIAADHIPVYRKLKTQHNEICHTKDVYEFHEVRENRKTHDSLLDNPFDREMHEILIALEKKEKKALKPIKRAVRAKRNNKKVISETENKLIVDEAKINKPEDKLENVRKSSMDNNQEPLENVAQEIDNNNTATDWGELFDDSLTEVQAPKTIETNKNPKNINVLSNICIISPEPDATRRVEFSKQIQERRRNTSMDWMDESRNELQEGFKRPNANSTMIFNPNSSPWRSNLIVKGSPRFLLTKKSNLPIYEQDMVINSSIVEKTLNNDSIAPIRKTKQSSLLNFITSNRVYDDSNKEKENDRSLYDEHLLSPIKKQQSPSKPVSTNQSIFGERNFMEVNSKNVRRPAFNERNSQEDLQDQSISQLSPRKILGERNYTEATTRNAKRRVFGERNSQEDMQDSIGRGQVFECYSVEDKENFDPEDSCFGFDASTKRSKSPRKKDAKKLSSKPTRIHVGEIKEVLLGGETRDATVGIVEDLENNDDDQNLLQQEEQASIVGLFEDLKENKAPPRVTYERKRTKRHRYYSAQEDDAEEIIPKLKKKKKDEPTKKELKEADEWAAAFNAMCQEVEAHTLEIE